MVTSCRLPDAVLPVKYSLCYDDLDLDKCTFSGQAIIECKVQLLNATLKGWYFKTIANR